MALSERIKWYWEDPSRIVRGIRRRFPGVMSVGDRATTSKTSFEGLPRFKKSFSNSDAAHDSLHRERWAREVFADRPWMVPIVSEGEAWIECPYLPDECRLDRVAASMTVDEKIEVSARVLSTILDMHSHGYFHGDIHCGNIFIYEGDVRVVDFERFGEYDLEAKPPFRESYDIGGSEAGAQVSPFFDGLLTYFCAQIPSGQGVLQLLGVPEDDVFEALTLQLKGELREACGSFLGRHHRNTLTTQRVYNSFELPLIKISPSESQRNTDVRFKQFGIKQELLAGKNLLDIGCNVGGMLFAAQQFEPETSTGIEYDSDKVKVARKVAALNGLNKVTFHQADVDYFDVEDIAVRPEVVFCFALISHVQKPERLYQLLGELTGEILFFEGNADTGVPDVEDALKKVGFRDVQFIGNCGDDVVDKNNKRPLFVAKK